jgi:hypothetical protein
MAIEKRKSKKTGKVTSRARLRFSGGADVSSTHERLTDARDWEAQARTRLKSTIAISSAVWSTLTRLGNAASSTRWGSGSGARSGGASGAGILSRTAFAEKRCRTTSQMPRAMSRKASSRSSHFGTGFAPVGSA